MVVVSLIEVELVEEVLVARDVDILAETLFVLRINPA